MNARRLAFCFVTDAGYALPSLVAAASVRKAFATSTADIYILAFSMEPKYLAELQRGSAEHHIEVINLERELKDIFDERLFESGYISKAAMGRFFIGDSLPNYYDNIIYIDGDTWVTAGIKDIVSVCPPPGKIAAVEDALISYARRDLGGYGKWVRRYYQSLGIPRNRRYFNSGVLIASTDMWKVVGRKALEFYLENTKVCIHPDQSALNAIAGDITVFISPRWNFTTQLMYYGVEAAVDPAIYHFTGYPKPWMGKFDPWAEIALGYQDRLKSFDGVNLPLKRLSELEAVNAQAINMKLISRLKTVLYPRLILRRHVVNKSIVNAWPNP